MLARLALAIVTVSLVAAVPARAATVDVGGLRVRTAQKPFGLSVLDRATGRAVLIQAPGTGAGPTGTLGFRAGARWFHATRAVRERVARRRYQAVLSTNDPGVRRIALTVGPDSGGRLLVRARVRGAPVAATGIAFRARRGERCR